MPRRSKHDSEATAARVLDVAANLFATTGYAAVGLEQVAAGAEVTRGAVYHHYGSKSGLFDAVLAQAQRRVADHVTAETESAQDPWVSLELGCRAFLEASTRDDVRRVMLVDAPAVVGWARWREQDAASSGRLLLEVLEELQSLGLLSAPPQATAALLSGAMNEAALWVAEAPDRAAALTQAGDTLQRMLTALR